MTNDDVPCLYRLRVLASARELGSVAAQLIDPTAPERLGHATVSITLDTCSHAVPAMQEEAARLIAGLVFAETLRPTSRLAQC
jgi:hypothetical protein